MLNSVPNLPRAIDFSPGIWPPAPIHRVAHPGTCRHCGRPVAMFIGPLHHEVAHVETERSRCNTDAFHVAAYTPTCPGCGGHNLTTNTTDPWADITTCADCDYTDRQSLGD